MLVSVARAGLSPESVGVVVNADSWASVTVANEYARLRHIPASNFVFLSGLSAVDFTDVDRVRSEILSPVLGELSRRGLRDQIDCIAYSLDIPCAASVGSDMAGGAFHQVITPVAAVNALTFLYEPVLAKDAATYLDLDVNRYARRTLPLAGGMTLSPEQRAGYQRGMKLYDAKKHAEAADAIGAIAKAGVDEPDLLYNLACCEALAGRGEEAIATLRRAVAAGWRNHGQASSDPDFASIASRPEFKELLADMQNAVVRVQLARGFESSIAWDRAGEPAASAGSRYLLSTFLGVASGRGNSVGEVLECLRRSEASDGTSPSGTVYFVKNTDVRSTTREWAFAPAQEAIGRLGVKCEIEKGVLPSSHADVAGAVVGIAGFDWSTSRSTILPGAICEHLTSCGGMMGERDGQTPCTDFIRAGAAGTSGAVTEPYALQQKFPDAFVHARYAAGCTLAEAFYQSVRGPYQLLIIGDPLCAPWSGAGRVVISGVSKERGLRDVVTVRASVNGGPAPVTRYELFVDGRLFAAGAGMEKSGKKDVKQAQEAGPSSRPGEFSLDTRLLGDGEHTISVVAEHEDAIQTRSRGEVTVRVANHDRVLKVVKKPQDVTFGEMLRVQVECEGARRMDLVHLGRVVGSVRGAAGVIEVDSTLLGIGEYVLRPVARLADPVSEETGKENPASAVFGPVLRAEVVAPTPARAASAGAPSADKGLGLRFWSSQAPGPATGAKTPPEGKTGIVADMFDPAWIAKAGVTPKQRFELVGSFEVSEADLYQVQLRTNTGASIQIDGTDVRFSGSPEAWAAFLADATAPDSWRFAPVRLAPGRHTLLVQGVAPDSPRLDLRLGARGTRHPGEGWFTRAKD